jgi:hypothetical protein
MILSVAAQAKCCWWAKYTMVLSAYMSYVTSARHTNLLHVLSWRLACMQLPRGVFTAQGHKLFWAGDGAISTANPHQSGTMCSALLWQCMTRQVATM